MVIKVAVEISGATTSFIADVWAESVIGAINLVNACYKGYETRLLFPIDPDTFFAEERAAGPMIISSEVPRATASTEEEGEVALAKALAKPLA
jgi:hypothetical protein